MSQAEFYRQCSTAATTNGGSGTNDYYDGVLRCYGSVLQEQVEGNRSFARSVLLVFAAALVFFMQAGFAMVCAGAVRTKNVQNTMLKNLLDACGAAVAFFAVGYAFAFGGDNGGSDQQQEGKTFIGSANFFAMNVPDYAFWLFQYAFSAASTTIVAGTLAERCQMAAYLCYSVLLAGWVYPVVAHSVWSTTGFLSATGSNPLWGVGMIDFAGSAVVHVTGGFTALIATQILGPRRGRFHDETGRPLSTPRDFAQHSIALQMLGTFILWFGWYGFNAGSALLYDHHRTTATSQTDNPNDNTEQVAALAAVNTTLAGGTAGMVALFVNLFILERLTGEPYFDLKYLMNGSLSGLVAITGGCGVLEPWAAVVVGCFAGLLYIGASRGLVKLRLDDAVDAIPVHLINGCWGTVAVGLFAAPRRLLAAYGRDKHVGWFYSFRRGSADATLLGTQLVGLLFILGWVLVFMLPFFLWLDWRGWFRSDPLEEIVGLDTSYHGGIVLLADKRGEQDVIKPEFIDAYKKRKEEEMRLRSKAHGHAGNNDTDIINEVMEHEEDDHQHDPHYDGHHDAPNGVGEDYHGEYDAEMDRHQAQPEADEGGGAVTSA